MFKIRLPLIHTVVAADLESSKELQMVQILCIHYNIINKKRNNHTVSYHHKKNFVMDRFSTSSLIIHKFL